VPYKGPVLAAAVYGHLSLRQIRDLDILVHPSEVRPAGELLISQGYRRERHRWARSTIIPSGARTVR
jgi:hypothetical protein